MSMFFDFNNVHKISPDLLKQFIGFQFEIPKYAASSYPPYNMIKNEDGSIILELAVAGFSQEELEVVTSDGQLKVIGKKSADAKTDYLHRGISGRDFERNFVLDKQVVVEAASHENGILKIALRRVIPENEKPRKIEIGKASMEKSKRQILMEQPLL
jgi:molecular chaperone IbpA